MDPQDYIGLLVLYVLFFVAWVITWANLLKGWGSWYGTRRKQKRRFCAAMVLLSPIWPVPTVGVGVYALLYWVARLTGIVFGHDKRVRH